MRRCVRDWYAREEGGGAAPSPALTKAIMVNTATDEVGGDDGAGGTNANAPDPGPGLGPGEPAAPSSTARRASSSTRARS